MLRGLASAAPVLTVFTVFTVFTISACKPDLPQTDPVPVVRAEFDPTKAKVPLPNDLALPPFSAPNSTCPGAPAGTVPACAQAELLTSFNGQFPSDQEVAITIDFVQTNFDASGKTVEVAPELDLASFTPSTFFVNLTTAAGQSEVALEPITAADYVKGTDHGTLTLHQKGHAPWSEGSYAVLVRGGPDGVKTKDAVPIAVGPSQVFSLLEQGLDMTDPKNIGLLKAQFGTAEAAIAQGMQLNLLIAFYKATAFPVADTRFPHQELAILTTFKVGPAYTNVTIDPARGLVPLPIDLLRDPAKGTLTPLAACTLAGSSLSADGTCPSPAAAGFLALDGFSTTGAILGPTSDLIQAATVTPTSLLLYELPVGGTPTQVPPASLIIEPCEFTSACGSPTALSPVIAIQPAGATAGDPSSVFRTRPLKDNTDYAVVMTTAIHDKAGKPLAPGTVAQVLQFTNPVSVGGHSALQGIDDVTTAQLEKMRLQLKPVFAQLPQGTKVAMAYTFHTQTILSQAVQLAALPYTTPDATAATGPVSGDKATVLAKYGAGSVPTGNIGDLFEADITTFNALDPATGAFLADPTKAVAEPIHVLIAAPKPSAVTKACGVPGVTCAPLMVFRHGLGRGRIDMLAIADAYAKAGMITVAIDAAKHGDRSFCTSGPAGPATGCVSGACTTMLPAGAQGDANPPGTCPGGFIKRGLDGVVRVDGIPVVSGNFLVSANFFRTRDSMRQDLIDESQLIRALAFNPAGGGTNTVFNHLTASGLMVDPGTIYYSGQSLGSIQGTMDVATNPRISKAVFNVGGGSIVDIFTNAPAFASTTAKLLAGLGIAPGTAAYLQFLVVAKTVLDPADPINFAGHLTGNTLPNLLPPLGGKQDGSVPQTAKKILTQIAYCDNTVPNPFNLIHTSTIGVGPTPAIGAAFFAPGATGTFQLFVDTGFDPVKFGQDCAGAGSGGTVTHGFLLDFANMALTAKAQADAAGFVTADTLPPSVQ